MGKIFICGFLFFIAAMPATSSAQEGQPCGWIRCDKGFTCVNKYLDGICVKNETVAAQAKPTWYSNFTAWLIRPAAIQQVPKAAVPAMQLRSINAVTNPAQVPCISVKKTTDKRGLDCAAPKKETWKKDANGNDYAVCEEPAPKTSAICYWDWENKPQGPPSDWKCNDTPN